MSSVSNLFTFLMKPMFEDESPNQDEEPPHLDLEESQETLKNFSTEDVSTIQTPRTKIVAINRTATLEEAIQVINSSGFSKLPVIEGNRDNIVGVVYAKDILKKFPGNLKATVDTVMHQAHHVTYSMTISQLINFMASHRTTIAFVIDEFGGVDGLVTLNDVNWELFGKIKDKFDTDDEPKLVRNGNRIIVDGDYDMEDFIEFYKVSDMDPDGSETLAGYICHSIGRIPEIGEDIEINDFRFRIVDGDNKKINKISIEKTPHN